MSETKLCATCRHWEPDRDDDYDLPSKLDLRKCRRIPAVFHASDWGQDDDLSIGRVLKPEFAKVKAFAQDGSGYVAKLITLPDFGCVMHEETEP